MGRKPKLVLDSDGEASLRVQIPRPIWLTVSDFATRMKISPEAAIRFFFVRIGSLFGQGDIAFMGPEWVDSLRAVKEANFGVINAGPTIDLSKLHRSNKTKSGYVGVYANGKGFRAMAKVQGAQQHLGTYGTAEEAAWRRYMHYTDNHLPYGELETEIEKWRAEGVAGTDEQLTVQILQHAEMVGTLHQFVAGAPVKPLEPLGFSKPPPTYESDLTPAVVEKPAWQAPPRVLSDKSNVATKPLWRPDVKRAPFGLINDEHPPTDMGLINEPEDHPNGLINEGGAAPVGFKGALPSTFDDDYIPEPPQRKSHPKLGHAKAKKPIEVYYGDGVDQEPGTLYHKGCGGEVFILTEGRICQKCNANSDHE